MPWGAFSPNDDIALDVGVALVVGMDVRNNIFICLRLDRPHVLCEKLLEAAGTDQGGDGESVISPYSQDILSQTACIHRVKFFHNFYTSFLELRSYGNYHHHNRCQLVHGNNVRIHRLHKNYRTDARRDFYAIYECEHCCHELTGTGYDDDNFHRNVIPKMKCKNCGKISPDEYRPFATKYPANAVI